MQCWGHPWGPRRPAQPSAQLCQHCPGGHFCSGCELQDASRSKSWKDFLNQISLCLSLSLDGGWVVFLTRYVTARRGAPRGHETSQGPWGGRGGSPGQRRWLRPPLAAAAWHRRSPGPGPLRPLSCPMGCGGHSVGTALHRWHRLTEPRARPAATTACSTCPMAQPAQPSPAQPCQSAAGAPVPAGQLPARFTCYTGLIGLKEIAGSLITEPIERHISA